MCVCVCVCVCMCVCVCVMQNQLPWMSYQLLPRLRLITHFSRQASTRQALLRTLVRRPTDIGTTMLKS